jgi:hypothetical protein
MEQEQALDRLASVSRLFMDARVVELRKQNERLKLELFWIKHSIQKLKDIMKHANYGRDASVSCNCWKCSLAKRIPKGTLVDNNKKCKFLPYFEALMQDCELSYEGLPGAHTHENHISDEEGNVCDVDSHFVETTMRGGFLHKFTYGSKLWKAKSVDNPELKKLERLFNLLSAEDGAVDA